MFARNSLLAALAALASPTASRSSEVRSATRRSRVRLTSSSSAWAASASAASRFTRRRTRLYWPATWPTSVKASARTGRRRSPPRACRSSTEANPENSVVAPCSLAFRPTRSARGVTRSPPPGARWKSQTAGTPTPRHSAAQAATPSACAPTCPQRVRPVPRSSRSPKSPTASVPHAPAIRCTGAAPTTSSTRSRSSSQEDACTSAAAAAPMTTASNEETAWQPAVMATSPPSRPLISGVGRYPPPPARPSATPTASPAEPASTVLATTPGTAPVSPSVLPPLKPSQPTQIESAPSTASGRLLAVISRGRPVRSKRPSRGPTATQAMSANQPPTECTTVDPAKSTKPRPASHVASPVRAPPQAQCPKTA